MLLLKYFFPVKIPDCVPALPVACTICVKELFLSCSIISSSSVINFVSFNLLDFKANFLKRAEGDVHFYCNMGMEISDLVSKNILLRVLLSKIAKS